MWTILVENWPQLAAGLAATLSVSACALALGAPLGLALARLARGGPIARGAAAAYVSFWRGTPILVQLLLIFYALPLVGLELSPFAAAVISLAFNTGAFQAEIYRAGLASVPRGEIEAGRMLGLPAGAIFLRIEAPQAIRAMLPALIGEMMALVRNSSLVSVIAVADLTRRAQQIAAATFRPLEAYGVALFFYLALAAAFALASLWAERRLSAGRAGR